MNGAGENTPATVVDISRLLSLSRPRRPRRPAGCHSSDARATDFPPDRLIGPVCPGGAGTDCCTGGRFARCSSLMGAVRLKDLIEPELRLWRAFAAGEGADFRTGPDDGPHEGARWGVTGQSAPR